MVSCFCERGLEPISGKNLGIWLGSETQTVRVAAIERWWQPRGRSVPMDAMKPAEELDWWSNYTRNVEESQ